MRFTKMHGAGNDYVYVDCFVQPTPKDIPQLAVAVSRPHFGIGADGLILIEQSDCADARMRIFNADGSEGMMCGNGVRCVAKYLYDSGICTREALTVETHSGIKRVELVIEDGQATGARVDMGAPVLDTAHIPAIFECGRIVAQPVMLSNNKDIPITCVSMGNPHVIVLVDELPDNDTFSSIGRELESHKMFPERANVEFVRVVTPTCIEMRVWERGSGETLACGSGACAALVAAVLNGCAERAADVWLTGGNLFIEWSETDGHVYMTGPAKTVFAGEWLE